MASNRSKEYIIIISMLGLWVMGFFLGAVSFKDCGNPREAYLGDFNKDGIQDVKVIFRYGEDTILYGTKGSAKLRLKADILKELEEQEGKKYK